MVYITNIQRFNPLSPTAVRRNILPESASYSILIFSHMKLCLATAIHNFMWEKITHICSIWDRNVTNPNV